MGCRSTFLFCWFLLISNVYSQGPERLKGECLVMVESIENQTHISFEINKSFNCEFAFDILISPSLNIWKASFLEAKVDPEKLLIKLKSIEGVVEAQWNHIIQNRATLPNDPNISSQWQYVNTGLNGGAIDADLDADDAWDITTGGVTPLGDTIVVCIIDDGIDLQNPDFGNNIWDNKHEIANNGIDDDGNGYVDDYRGWNADNNSNDISGGNWGAYHGTPVAGIVGAKGNNNVGVSGVNWDVKLMIVVGGGNEADAIAAYSYPLAMRKLYEQTNGQKGAYVVSTNASWGIDYGKAADAPLWCAMYDSLGKYGVLSAGATINSNVNVDIDGDLPTQCPSDYLIAVTNVDKTDTKVGGAGYGINSIDLGAFGADAYTLEKGGTYGGFGGTSGATPHVAGAVALMYSVPCQEFAQLVENDPELGAYLIKQYMLNSTDANSSLNGKTLSGGRLNLHKALLEIENRCGTFSCLEPIFMKLDSAKGTVAWISWSGFGGSDYEVQFREKAQTPGSQNTWLIDTTQIMTYSFNSLGLCKEYEVLIRALCDSGNTSAFADTFNFQSSGCCAVPTGLNVSSITATSVLVRWDSSYAPQTTYTVQYQKNNQGNWMNITNIDSNSLIIENLDSCTNYEVKVQSLCNGISTAFTTNLSFITEGCDQCLHPDYCLSKGDQVIDEWIEKVEISNYSNQSGSDGGFGDFTNSSIVLFKDSIYNLYLEPGFSSTPYDEFFSVWIDLNQDTDFDDLDENIFVSSNGTQTGVTVPLSVPSSALLGSTRMRVSMKYNSAPSACESNIPYGEVEDYCVEIDSGVSSVGLHLLSNNFIEVYPNPFLDKVVISGYVDRGFIRLFDLMGNLLMEDVIESKTSAFNFGDYSKGLYLLQIQDESNIIYKRLVKAQ